MERECDASKNSKLQPWGSEMDDSILKEFITHVFWRSDKLLLNIFFDLNTLFMRKADNVGEKEWVGEEENYYGNIAH